MKPLTIAALALSFVLLGCGRAAKEEGESAPWILQSRRTVSLGTFTVRSTRLVASDPGYTKDMISPPGLVALVEKCLPGTWRAEMVEKKFDPAGEVNSELYVFHDTAANAGPLTWTKRENSVGVDSGQAGIWDLAAFHDAAAVPRDMRWTFGTPAQPEPADPSDLWYSWCCELLKQAPSAAAVMPGGAVSNSGKGDGGYDLLVGRNAAGEAVALRIIFVDDAGRG